MDGHRRGRLAKRRQIVVEQVVAHVEVDGVHRQVVFARDGEGLVQPLRVDAELGRLVAAVVADAAVGVDGASAGVHAQPDRAAAVPPPVSADLADEVQVDVHAVSEDDVEVLVAHVGAGVADLGGRPALLQAVLHLAGGADVEADELRGAGHADAVDARQRAGLALRLDGPAHLPGQSGACHRALQGAYVLLHVREVVHEQRRALLARQLFRVTPGDQKSPIPDVEARPPPPVTRLDCDGLRVVGHGVTPFSRRRRALPAAHESLAWRVAGNRRPRPGYGRAGFMVPRGGAESRATAPPCGATRSTLRAHERGGPA